MQRVSKGKRIGGGSMQGHAMGEPTKDGGKNVTRLEGSSEMNMILDLTLLLI